MERKIIFFIIILMITLSCSREDNQYAVDINHFYGVWANENCELVKTGMYELLFERVDGKIYSSLRMIRKDKNKLFLETLGIARFDTSNQNVMIKARDLLSGGDIVFTNDTDNVLKMQEQTFEIKHYPEKITITSKGKTVGELAKLSQKLRLQFPSGRWQTLHLVEKIELSEPYTVIKATDDHLGTCLQQWRLGTLSQTGENGQVNTIQINTNKHSYVFCYQPIEENPFVYCRAARLRSNNNGSVFAQNIRLMNRPGLFTAVFPGDNYIEASHILAIQDSLFNPDECYYGKQEIYWSVKDYSDTLIVLNGCGQDYIYARPDTESNSILEWFEFAEY